MPPRHKMIIFDHIWLPMENDWKMTILSESVDIPYMSEIDFAQFYEENVLF